MLRGGIFVVLVCVVVCLSFLRCDVFVCRFRFLFRAHLPLVGSLV